MVSTTLDANHLQKALNWEPINWFSATWRDNATLLRSPARRFDTAAVKGNVDAFVVDWGKAPCELQLSTEEALFWFATYFGKTAADVSKLSEITQIAQSGNGKIDIESMKALLKRTRLETSRAHGLIPMQILHQLMTDADLVALLCDSSTMPTVHVAYRKRVLPFLSPEHKTSVKKAVEARLGATNWESDFNFAYYLAALLGMHDVTESLVGGWKDSYGVKCDTRTKALQLITFGLPSAESMTEHFKRLNLVLIDIEQVCAWIAHTVDSDLETVYNCMSKANFATDTEGMLKVVAQIDSAKTGEFMFDRLPEMRAGAIAADWMLRNLHSAVEALITISSKPGKRGDDAIAYLRNLCKKEGYELIEKVAAGMAPALVKRAKEQLFEPEGSELKAFDETTTPDWLSLAVAAEQDGPAKRRLPSWLHLSDLRPVTIGDYKLNDAQVSVLISSVQQSTLDKPSALALKLKQHADPLSLDSFALLIFDLWLRNGGSSKESWAMYALAFLGSDDVAMKLSAQIKVWPGESNHKRAVVGLECLRTIGTDVALMQINSIADKIQFKGLKGKAEECMTQIAESRGMSRERLGDRIIPTLGFEQSGQRILNFGPRHFVATIGDDLKLTLADELGKVRAELPAPNASDDAEMAEAATSEWKAMKKAVRDLMALQAFRLEQAMILGRKCFTDEFQNFVLRHPLMPHLLRQFVWGGFDMSGNLVTSFAVISRNEFRALNGDAIELSSFSEVGILHPLQLSIEDLAAWRQQFQERAIVQAFPQIDRATQTLSEKEVHDVEILRMRNYRIPAVNIVGVLDKRGWHRGPVEEGGIYTEHIKYFQSADVTAVMSYNGILTLMPTESDDQYIDYCAFLPGKVAATHGREFQKGQPLGTIDKAVLSEVLSDVEALRLKGKLGE